MQFWRTCVFDVLVEHEGQVKITDFGLAKVLEHNQEQIYGGGGKVMFSAVWHSNNWASATDSQEGTMYFATCLRCGRVFNGDVITNFGGRIFKIGQHLAKNVAAYFGAFLTLPWR